MQFVRNANVVRAPGWLFPALVWPSSAFAHGFGDYKVFTAFSVLLVVLVAIHSVGAMIVFRKEKFGSRFWLRLSLGLSAVSILVWLFVFKIAMDSHSANIELFVVLGVLFLLIGLFAVLPVKQYERLTYGDALGSSDKVVIR